MSKTTQDPATLEARELDALVAEKVMGFRWAWYCGSGAIDDDLKKAVLLSPDWWENHGDPLRYRDAAEGELRRTYTGPRFSTDPAASRELTRAMEAKGWDWSVETLTTPGQYLAMVLCGGNTYHAEADTPERALALAALKALEAAELRKR